MPTSARVAVTRYHEGNGCHREVARRMSESDIGTEQTLGARIGGTILLLIFAVPFGHEGAKRLLDGERLTGAFAFFIAVVLGVTAIVWVTSATVRARFAKMVVDPRYWFAVLSAVILYFGASHINFGREGPQGATGPKGEQGPAGLQGPSGTTQTTDPRVTELLGKVTTLETKLSLLATSQSDLHRLVQVENCVEKINKIAPKDGVDGAVARAKARIINPPRMVGINEWNQLLQEATAIFDACYHKEKLELKYDPTGEQMDNRVPGEPTLTLDNMDLDSVHRFRRFYWQSDFVVRKINELRERLTGEVTSIKWRIIHTDP